MSSPASFPPPSSFSSCFSRYITPPPTSTSEHRQLPENDSPTLLSIKREISSITSNSHSNNNTISLGAQQQWYSRTNNNNNNNGESFISIVRNQNRHQQLPNANPTTTVAPLPVFAVPPWVIAQELETAAGTSNKERGGVMKGVVSNNNAPRNVVSVSPQEGGWCGMVPLPVTIHNNSITTHTPSPVQFTETFQS
eukprot:PhF_6_TR40419/c1_g1_i2/m.60248